MSKLKVKGSSGFPKITQLLCGREWFNSLSDPQNSAEINTCLSQLPACLHLPTPDRVYELKLYHFYIGSNALSLIGN